MVNLLFGVFLISSVFLTTSVVAGGGGKGRGGKGKGKVHNKFEKKVYTPKFFGSTRGEILKIEGNHLHGVTAEGRWNGIPRTFVLGQPYPYMSGTTERIVCGVFFGKADRKPVEHNGQPQTVMLNENPGPDALRDLQRRHRALVAKGEHAFTCVDGALPDLDDPSPEAGDDATRGAPASAGFLGRRTDRPADEVAAPGEPTCSVCLTNVPNTLLVPCGHACFCGKCAGEFLGRDNKCPICRGPVTQDFTIYGMDP